MKANLRDVFSLRGRLVRLIAQYSGSANSDRLFAAMCDAAEFNRANPQIAIPNAARVTGTSALGICGVCAGEGSRAMAVGATIPIHGDVVTRFEERICPTCGGSGFRDVYDFGENAVRGGGHRVQASKADADPK